MNGACFLQRFGRDERGVAAVETVLIMPLAVILLTVAMEAGHFLYTEHQVITGVRDAARFAARQPFSVYGCTAASAEADLPASTTRTQIANMARYGLIAPVSTDELRVWTWDDNATELKIRYACVSTNGGSTGIFKDAGEVAPLISVTGKPNYYSLFGNSAFFNSTMVLYAKEQAMGAGI
jgi:Flp pilus assembly pilin Flp